MSDGLLGGVRQYVRLRQKHEDDALPVVLWLVIAFAMSITSGYVGGELLKMFGYRGRIPVEIVGGGSSTTVMMESSSYYAGPFIQIPVLLLTFSVLYLYGTGVVSI